MLVSAIQLRSSCVSLLFEPKKGGYIYLGTEQIRAPVVLMIEAGPFPYRLIAETLTCTRSSNLSAKVDVRPFIVMKQYLFPKIVALLASHWEVVAH
jgi:hypothetical protein